MKSFLLFFKSKNQAFALPILSGVLIGFSYIPFTPWVLLLSYVPLFLDLQNPFLTLRQVFWKGWWTQFILSLIGFHWVSFVSHEFGFMPWPIALLVLFLFASFIHLYIPLALVFAAFLRKKLELPFSLFLVILPLILSLFEILWPSIFPWNQAYVLLWIRSPVAQTAELWGFQGLSLIILSFQAALAFAWVNRNQIKRSISVIIVLLGIYLSLHFLGEGQRSFWQESPQSLKVLVVQGNIGNLEKYYAEKGSSYKQFIINEFFDLTRSKIREQKPDLIVWPETGFPAQLNPQFWLSPYSSQFFRFVNEIKVPILTGGFSQETLGQSTKEYNGLFLYDENAQLLGRYHKTYLLAFGEYTPFTDYFPSLKKISPAGEGFSRGEGPQIIPFREGKVGPQICYEGLYPEFAIAAVRKGADFLVNLTNDSWFGPRSEPHQHLTMTLARALEVRRPLIRATNTGISTVILADGTILSQSPLHQKWAGFYEVKWHPQAPLTFYTYFQPFLPFLEGFLIFLLAVIWNYISQKRKTFQQ